MQNTHCLHSIAAIDRKYIHIKIYVYLQYKAKIILKENPSKYDVRTWIFKHIAKCTYTFNFFGVFVCFRFISKLWEEKRWFPVMRRYLLLNRSDNGMRMYNDRCYAAAAVVAVFDLLFWGTREFTQCESSHPSICPKYEQRKIEEAKKCAHDRIKHGLL